MISWYVYLKDYARNDTPADQPVKVPIGKLAFMPGRIVHTNEVLALLGDNWFAEVSAKEAAAIVARRQEGKFNW